MSSPVVVVRCNCWLLSLTFVVSCCLWFVAVTCLCLILLSVVDVGFVVVSLWLLWVLVGVDCVVVCQVVLIVVCCNCCGLWLFVVVCCFVICNCCCWFVGC